METIGYAQLDERIYFDRLDNGLEVYILPKKGFHKKYATFTTKYGSVDNRFVPYGQKDFLRVPDGIAHFLEHKLFEKEDGDVFQKFVEQGAQANAFTSFTRTAYLFSCTENFRQNLTTLLDFVQEPYFSEKTVEKEKGIIGQEIRMYDDNPDWRLYFGSIGNLYHYHPVRIDIAGTIESIAKIDKDLLYTCYNTFYHPSNMLLFVVGSVDPEETLDLVKENQGRKSFRDRPGIRRQFEKEPPAVARQKQIVHMDVQTPKCMVGIKGILHDGPKENRLKTELSVQLLLDFLFSRSSPDFQKLYEEGLIDDSFLYDYTQEEGFSFVLAGGDTENPDRLASEIQDLFLKAKETREWNSERLERTKRNKIGAFLRALNSPEFIANQFTRYHFNSMDLFQVIPLLESIGPGDVEAAARQLIAPDRMAVFQIIPKP